jgi:hypothetical protein
MQDRSQRLRVGRLTTAKFWEAPTVGKKRLRWMSRSRQMGPEPLKSRLWVMGGGVGGRVCRDRLGAKWVEQQRRQRAEEQQTGRCRR